MEQDKKLIAATAAATAVNNNNSQKMGNDISTEIFSASNENGKINVQVTVLVGEFLINNYWLRLLLHALSVWSFFSVMFFFVPNPKGSLSFNVNVHIFFF